MKTKKLLFKDSSFCHPPTYPFIHQPSFVHLLFTPKVKTLLQRVHLCVLLISTPQVYFRNWCVLQCDVLRVTPGSQTGGIIIREITSCLNTPLIHWCFGFSQFPSCLITYRTLISFPCVELVSPVSNQHWVQSFVALLLFLSSLVLVCTQPFWTFAICH